MLTALLLSSLLSQAADPQCARGRCRVDGRGMTAAPFAFFEFAPTGGAGMSAACAGTAITGAKGEALTFTRTGNATCSKQGLATTGINNGDLVVLAGDIPRVEPSGGVLGLRVESARSNVCVRSAELCNAAWADVGTPGCSSDSMTGPLGTQTMDTLDDNDGAAFEGRSQTVTVSAATAYVMTCYVKAGTQTAARLSLDGTTADCTGLSTTTSTRCQVADASSSGVAISAQVLVGDGAGDTGTIYVEGCQVEAGTYPTSYIPTVAAAVTRNAESPYLTVSAMTARTYCAFGNFETPYNITGSAARVMTLWQSGGVFTDDYFPTNFTAFLFDGVTTSTLSATAVTTSGRVGSRYDLANLTACVSGVCNSSAGVRTINNITRVRLGVDGSSGTVGHLNGIITRVQVDPSPTRCSP